MDTECINLVKALNDIPGVYTHNSCCGHGKEPFRIWFEVVNYNCLFLILRAISHNYWNVAFECKATNSDVSGVKFQVESLEKGVPAYKEADRFSEVIHKILSSKNLINHYIYKHLNPEK